MPQVTRKAYFTHEFYDATSEDLKDQVGSSYRIYYYNPRGWWAGLNLSLNIPAIATNVRLSFYIKPLPSKDTKININNVDRGLANVGWNTFEIENRSSYRINAYGTSKDYPAYYYMYGISGGEYRPYVEYTVAAPDVSNIRLDTRSVDQAITVSFTLRDATSWTLQAIKDNVVVATRTGTTTMSATFNPSELPVGDVTFRVTATNGAETMVGETVQTLTAPTPNISNIQLSGLNVEAPIICTAAATNTTSWEVQAIRNNVVVATKTGTGPISATFNAGEFNYIGDTTFRVIGYNMWTSGYKDRNVTLTAPMPSISNIQLSNLSVDTPIVCTATVTNTTSWKVETIQNNAVVASKTGTGAISATFKVGEIVNIGDTTFRVTATNKWGSEFKDRNVTLTAPKVSVSNFLVLGTNIDETITCTAEGTNVYSWTVQAIQNGILKASKSGTGNTINCKFSNGEINTKGSTEFKLLYVNTWNNNQTSQTVTLTRTEPKVIAIEPNGVTANRDVIIPVTWSSENQQSFTLDVDGNVYTGTTAKGVNIPAGTIKSLGTKQITLSIKYQSSWGEVRTDSKTVTFIATGKPKVPKLDEHTHYDKALPTFTWTCENEYVQYRLQVLNTDGEVVDDSDNVVGSGGSYTCQTILSNQTTYTVRVKVKTAYGYWSDWATKTFTTDFVMANKPTIRVFSSNNSIIVNSFTKYSEPFDYCDIYRKTEHGKWVRIAHKLDNDISFKDHYVGKEKYYYKVASVSTSGGINDSDVASATIDIKNFNFVNIENLNNSIEFEGNPEVQITDIFESVSNEYAGVFAPIFEEGEHNYRTGSCSFVCSKALYDQFKLMINKSKVLMYRDCRGEKIYCKVTGNITRPKFAQDWITISFKFVEVPFLEQDTYIGYGNTWSIFWDGTYKWDGIAFWDGDTHSETQVYDGQGNQKLVFEDGYYKWKERDANES